ncbi:MAG: serine hydrolase domain-containing protein [Myxococcota bacterium]
MKERFSDKIRVTLDALLEEGVAEGVFPSASTVVSSRKSGIIAVARGYYDRLHKASIATVYDLASLTKPLATTLLAMRLFDEEKLPLENSAVNLLPVAKKKLWKGITLSHLLDHTSGLKPWLPLYALARSPESKDVIAAIEKKGFSTNPGEKTIYSDLNFILLWHILQGLIEGEPAKYIVNKIYRPFGVEELWFAGDSLPEKSEVAPTEFRGDFGKPLAFISSDCNSRFLGGVSGHAGLFGTALGVHKIASLLLKSYKGKRVKNFISPKTTRFFWNFRRAGMRHFALGWDRPAKIGSLAGTKISRNAVGHLGFSGTSLWIDVEREIIIVLLTNRTFPHRLNEKIKSFRPYFQDKVMDILVNSE